MNAIGMQRPMLVIRPSHLFDMRGLTMYVREGHPS